MRPGPTAQQPPKELPITFQYLGRPAFIEFVGHYQDGTCCLEVTDRDPDDPTPLARITVCLNIPLPPGHFWIKTWGGNEPMAEALLAQGVFEDTGTREPSGFVQVPCWRLPGYKIDLRSV